MDATAHRKISDTIDDRLTRVWAVYGRVREEALNLTLLAYAHYILSAIPNAEYLALMVTDQGGDHMTFNGIGVGHENYLAWAREFGIDTDRVVPQTLDRTGQDYVEIHYDHPVLDNLNDDGETILSEDSLSDYASSMTDAELSCFGWFERIGGRHSGMGRIWLAPLLAALNATYEGFVKDTLDPMPDPQDQVALAEWLAREIAPTEEEEPLCGCGERHAIHLD